jgi:hypothetical protein
MSVISLDAFEASLRGQISVWYVKDDMPAHPAGFVDQVYADTPPIRRKILLTAPTSSQAWSVVDTWIVVYKVSSPVDWALVVAILQNQSEPYIVCVAPELKPPADFFKKIHKLPHMTMILYSVLDSAKVAVNPYVSSYFFPSVSPIDTVLVEHIGGIVRSLVGNTSFAVKDVLKDIYSAQAGLVVSNVGYSAYHVFWYYATAAGRTRSPLLELIQAFIGQG